VAVAYDSGGKWGILESLGYGDYIINYKDITPEKLRDRVIACWENREQLLKYVETKVEENIDQVGSNVNRLKQLVNLK